MDGNGIRFESCSYYLKAKHIIAAALLVAVAGCGPGSSSSSSGGGSGGGSGSGSAGGSNDSRSSASPMSPSGTMSSTTIGGGSGAIDPVGDRDYRYFDIDVSGSFEFGTRNADVDTVCELTNESGDVIIYDDDGGQDNNCFFSVSGLNAGRYYVLVEGYRDETGAYDYFFGFDPSGSNSDQGCSNNNSSACAQDLGSRSAGAVSGEISYEGDRDWYRVTSPYHAREIKLYTEGATDTYCRLFDEFGGQLASSDDHGQGSNCQIIAQNVSGIDPGEEYYIEVSGYADRAVGPYSLYYEFN